MVAGYARQSIGAADRRRGPEWCPFPPRRPRSSVPGCEADISHLIHDPAVLLLDEPTSGLDSVAALHVVQMLHAMARAPRPRTIILTIHQPGYRILSLVSSVLLLARGSVAHHGSLESLEYSLLSAGVKIPAQLNAMEIISEPLGDRGPGAAFWQQARGAEPDRDAPTVPLLLDRAEEELAEDEEGGINDGMLGKIIT